MPPPLFFILQLPFTQLAYAIFPVAIANGIISGSFTFCKDVTFFQVPRYNLLMQIFFTTACTMRK